MAIDISDEEKKKISIMRSLPFFKVFTEDELAVLLKSSIWQKHSHGSIIFREGEVERSFFVVLKGDVDIQKKIGLGLRKKSVGTLGKGQCFGEMSLITGEARSADAVSKEETFLLKIDAVTLNKETDSIDLKSLQFKFYKLFCEILAERLNKVNRELIRTL